MSQSPISGEGNKATLRNHALRCYANQLFFSLLLPNWIMDCDIQTRESSETRREFGFQIDVYRSEQQQQKNSLWMNKRFSLRLKQNWAEEYRYHWNKGVSLSCHRQPRWEFDDRRAEGKTRNLESSLRPLSLRTQQIMRRNEQILLRPWIWNSKFNKSPTKSIEKPPHARCKK